MISKTHTLDGVKVEPGLRVWDYNLDRRIVGEVAHVSHDVPWYAMTDPETGTRGSDMDPSRMWVRDPWTGERA
jgi:hypothetical protein